MKQLPKRLLLPTIISVVACNTATAKTVEPAKVPWGPISAIPTVDFTNGYDDNLLGQSINQVETWVTVLTPKIELIAEDGMNAYRVSYELSRGVHSNSSSDNYTDHDLTAEAHLEFSQRSKLDLSASYIKEHEDRGTGLTGTDAIATGLATSVIEYDEEKISAAYTYGAADADGKIVVDANFLDREYTNFRAVTADRDKQVIDLGATFFYGIMPNTEALFEVRHKDTDYDMGLTNRLDNKEWRYYVGAKWDSTANTSGTVKLGYLDSEFDSNLRPDFDLNIWDVTLNWAPLSYSRLKLNTSRDLTESTNNATDFTDITSTNLDWDHDWSDIISSNLNAGISNEEAVGNPSGQEEDFTTAGVGLTYDIQRWLTVGFKYSYKEKDSNIAASDYDRNIYLISVSGSL